ncbi:MAG: CapA family protein [Clostridia bacterium]|nr:CapA family protein [Clostridia bacterium]MDD4386856.1 CapA family protein [Clostridia bacterium]
MGNNSRIRINLIRKRFNFRNNKINKIILISTSIVMVIFLFVIIGVNTNHDKTVIASSDNEVKSVVADDIVIENDTNNTENTIPEEQQKTDASETVNPVSNEIKLTILGEMMMGSDVTTNTSYLYSSAFKKIFNLTRNSDFTYANLSTNITNLDKIEDAKSGYLVTKEIKSAITSLGIDAVNIASDHMTDFPKEIFNNTLSILKDNNTYISGINNSILYLEKNGKKIAIIAANNVFIGTKNNYTDYGINVYSKDKMKNDIAEANENADIVIVDIHWGREYIYGVTTEMKKIAYSAIDSGADLVMGSHSLGIYPIIIYKNVPIIYSTGYLMTDSSSEIAQKSYIFDININKENKINSLEMLPIYINEKKEVMTFYEYNKDLAYDFNTKINTWNIENNLNSKIVDDKIVITF